MPQRIVANRLAIKDNALSLMKSLQKLNNTSATPYLDTLSANPANCGQMWRKMLPGKDLQKWTTRMAHRFS
jgi:hypothetical protein